MIYWLRWLGVLPAALLARILADLLLHWLLYAPCLIPESELSPFANLIAYMIPEAVLSCFVGAIAFVWAGASVAPSHPTRTATALFGCQLLVFTVLTTVALSGGEIFGRQAYMQYDGIASVMGLIGAGIGLYAVRKAHANSRRMGPGATATLTHQPSDVSTYPTQHAQQ